MSRFSEFTFQRKSRDGGLLKLDGVIVAAIRRLELFNFSPRIHGEPIVGDEVGVPLYWRQYGDHQNPERSANSHRSISAVRRLDRSLQLTARGLTRSRGVESLYTVVFRVDGHDRIFIEVKARLEVRGADGWLVTPHPDHGEVTFCTLWPRGVFSPQNRETKRFQNCLVQRGARRESIEHHHLESPDKHHIRLSEGDRFAWGLEKVNPVITMGAGTKAEAGVCAYMWDVHFGLKVCDADQPITLPPGAVLHAAYTLGAVSRATLRPLIKCASVRSSGVALDRPVWTGGHHSFQKTFRSEGIDRNTAWPWQTEVTRGDDQQVRFSRDVKIGCADSYSLKIKHHGNAQSSWQATTLGPAFGERPFCRGGRLRIKSMVRLGGAEGKAQVVLRLHREDRGSVYAVSDYELYPSDQLASADQEWRELVVTTPRLSPAPDRVHVILQLDGPGTAWFDEVELIRLR